jgi:sialidase-1
MLNRNFFNFCACIALAINFSCSKSAEKTSKLSESQEFSLGPSDISIPSINGTPTIGTNSEFPDGTTGNASNILATSCFSNTSTVNSLSVHVIANPAGGKIRLGIYEDASGSPGNLVASTSEITALIGWNNASITATQIPSGKYWLAFRTDSDALKVSSYYSVDPDVKTAYKAVGSYASLPNAYPTAATYAGVKLSIFASIDENTKVGGNIAFSGGTTNNAQYILANPYYNYYQGSIKSMSIYVLANPNNAFIRMGLYADSNGSPGNLILESAESVATVGWNTINVTPIMLTRGRYWLAFKSSDNATVVSAAVSSSIDTYYHNPISYGNMPGVFPNSPLTGAGVKISSYFTVKQQSVPVGISLSTWPIKLPTCNTKNGELYSDIIQLLSGKVLAVSTRFHSGYIDFDPSFLTGRLSDSTGGSWSDNPYIFNSKNGTSATIDPEPFNTNRVFNPSLLRLGNGDLGIFAQFVGLLTDGKPNKQDSRIYFQRSTDEGATWSSPATLVTDISPTTGYYLMNPGRAIRLSSGRIILPMAYEPDASGDHTNMVSLCYYSDDDGVSWHRGNTVSLNRGAHEPGVIELTNGKLLMNIRQNDPAAPYVFKSYSTDQGINWSAPVPMSYAPGKYLASPRAPATLQRLPSGHLLIVWNNASSPDLLPRTPLATAISNDEGDTWTNMKYLEDSSYEEYAYASIKVINSKIYISYYINPWDRSNNNANPLADYQFSRLRIIDANWFAQ